MLNFRCNECLTVIVCLQYCDTTVGCKRNCYCFISLNCADKWANNVGYYESVHMEETITVIGFNSF